jgi:hypothetical protein
MYPCGAHSSSGDHQSGNHHSGDCQKASPKSATIILDEIHNSLTFAVTNHAKVSCMKPTKEEHNNVKCENCNNFHMNIVEMFSCDCMIANKEHNNNVKCENCNNFHIVFMAGRKLPLRQWSKYANFESLYDAIKTCTNYTLDTLPIYYSDYMNIITAFCEAIRELRKCFA